MKHLRQALSCSWQSYSPNPKLPPWSNLERSKLELKCRGPQANGLSSIPLNASLFSITGPLISHFENSHFTLTRTIESLKIDQALNSLSFGWKLVNSSKYQTLSLQVQALNSSTTPFICHMHNGATYPILRRILKCYYITLVIGMLNNIFRSILKCKTIISSIAVCYSVCQSLNNFHLKKLLTNRIVLTISGRDTFRPLSV